MNAESFISKRIRFRGRIASVCVAVSFLVIIVAVAVSSGFREEIRDGLSDVCGDVTLVPLRSDGYGANSGMPSSPAFLPRLNALPFVESVRGSVSRVGIIKEGDLIHGVLFKGVEDYQRRDSSHLGVSVPSALASMLRIGVGDDVSAYFNGERVTVRKFRVESVYDAVLSGDDRLVVKTDLNTVRRVNGWTDVEVSSLEVRLRDRFRSERMMTECAEEIGATVREYSSEDEPTVIATSLVQAYPQLFDWFSLIDFNVAVVLALMIAVAGFNMISGLLILLFENISTIGLLKALGMTDRGIAGVFLRSSAVLVGKGMAAGNLIAVLLCLVQDRTHLLKLSAENYFVSFVPVHLDWGWILCADALAFAAIMLLLLLPSIFISRIDPASTMRVE